MEEIRVRAKSWGNSIGIVLPSFVVKKERINEGTELLVNVRTNRKMTVGELMKIGGKLGIAKKLQHIDTQKALREVDRAFEGE